MINDKLFDHLDYDEWVKNRLITIRRFQKIRATYLQECQHEIFWQQDCQLLRIFLKNFDAPREGKLDLASVQSDSELSAEDLSLIKSDDSSNAVSRESILSNYDDSKYNNIHITNLIHENNNPNILIGKVIFQKNAQYEIFQILA